MLLQWCTLEPSGPSQLAALRFTAPVRVRSVRVFPKHAQPFASNVEIVSKTEPEAFFLEVFFNAQPISSPDSKQKQKATNSLVPTVIAYPGGHVDFAVDMGDECATRLMIVKGNFTKVSMAIYGDVVSELPQPSPSYEPMEVASVEPSPISPALDPANALDPTELACKLLSLIPDAPPLPLVIRLMFCLKPSNDDWDLPDFPYLHPDLNDDTMDFDLDSALRITSRPVADDVSSSVLQQFVDRIADSVGPKSEHQAYLMAGIFSHVASQDPDFPRLLTDRLDIRAIFSASTMDEDSLDLLLVAAANPDIARSLAQAHLGSELLSIEHNPVNDPYTKRAAHRLKERLQAWDELSEAMSSSRANFATARALLHEAGTDEPSFGVALHALVANRDIAARLAEVPVFPGTPFSAKENTHGGFVAYLRAWIGVACVLAVYAWADSVPNERCRERTFGVLRVWQSTPGYREILNHLLLMRQMIFRLECMMDDDTPTRSGIHAEHILHNLAQSPNAFLSEHLIKCLHSLQPGLSSINEDERRNLRELSLLADDGLPAALEELLRPLEHPLDTQTVRMVRVALAAVNQELEAGEEGEWRTLNALWDQRGHGLTLHLLEALCAFIKDIQIHFALTVPTRTPQALMAEFFLTTVDLMRVLGRLVPVYLLPGREARALVGALADLYSCADAADTTFTQGSDACSAAQLAHQACIDLVRSLAAPREGAPDSGELVLRTLLRHGTCPGGLDPAHHVLHVFALLDHFLPMPRFEDIKGTIDDVTWVRRAIPRVLTDITAFYRLLDPENRARFVRRLAELDEGVVGIGEWLVLEELKQLQGTMRVLGDPSLHEDLATFRKYQAVGSLRLLYDLTTGISPSSRRLMEYIGANAEAAGLLVSSLNSLLACRMFSLSQANLAKALITAELPEFDPHLAFSLALTFLRAVQYQSDPSPPLSSTMSRALDALKAVPIKLLDPEKLCSEICEALITICTSPGDNISEAESDSVLFLLEWLVERSHAGLPQLSTLKHISADTFSQLCDHLLISLPYTRTDGLELARVSITTAPEDIVVPPMILLPPSITMSLHRVDELFRESVAVPSTPKRSTPPHTQNVFGMVTVSPPTALLRSPAVTGLTKTYNANDFRSLRQVPSARQNTSRLPSTHVDEYESVTTSPSLVPGALPGLPPNPFANVGEGFGGLSAPFGGS